MKLPAYESKNPQRIGSWSCAYALDKMRSPIEGDVDELAAAIRRGADLRIYTEFRHNEHIDVKSPNPEMIKEVADFRITCLLDERRQTIYSN